MKKQGSRKKEKKERKEGKKRKECSFKFQTPKKTKT
jgi:hypothetical protein